MSKALTLGNGVVLVNLDNRGQVRDFYFPQVGLENHIGNGSIHRLGVWVDGQLSWTADPAWQVKISMDEDSLTGRLEAVNQNLSIKLVSADLIYNEKNIFVRSFQLTNLSDRPRQIKLFFG
jgi:GH15 family glucan-1,4-alpha-glucosidase